MHIRNCKKGQKITIGPGVTIWIKSGNPKLVIDSGGLEVTVSPANPISVDPSRKKPVGSLLNAG